MIWDESLRLGADSIGIVSATTLWKHLVLVVPTATFVLGLSATDYFSGGTSARLIEPWIGSTLRMLVCACLLCSSGSVDLDPYRRPLPREKGSSSSSDIDDRPPTKTGHQPRFVSDGVAQQFRIERL